MENITQQLPNWKILSKIPTHLRLKVTHCSVFPHKGSTEMYFVVNGNSDRSDVYRASLKVEGCTKVEQLRGKRIRNIVARNDVILVLTAEELYAIGNNRYGQIGNGEKNETMVEEPYLVMKAPILGVDIGSHHAMCLIATGEVFTWGSNTGGQLGYSEESLAPKRVMFEPPLNGQSLLESPDEPKFSEIACWGNVSFALSRDGRLYAWGENRYFTLIPGATLYQGRWNPKLVSPLENIRVKHVYSDDDRAFAVTEFGSLYGWGRNECGKLGLGHTNLVCEPTRLQTFDDAYARIKSVLIGPDFTIADSTNGLYVWGKFKIQGRCKFSNSKKEIEEEVIFCENHFPQLSACDSPLSIFVNETDRTPGLVSINDFKPAPALFAPALDDTETSDLKIKVDGRVINAHKAVLKIRSNHFRTMFSSDAWHESQSNEVPIEHSTYAVYHAYLYYLYTNQVNPDLSMEDAFHLMDLAGSYFEDELRLLICDFILGRSMNMDDVLHIYSLAVSHRAEHVASRCLDFILEHLAQLVKSPAFTMLDPVHAKEILLVAAKAELLKK